MPWLRVRAYAHKYGVSYATIWNWIRKKSVEIKKRGSTTFVLDDDGSVDRDQLSRLESKIDTVLTEVVKLRARDTNGAR